MDFQLSEDQIMLRDSTRDFARERLAPLAKEADARGFALPEIRRELAELGYFGICTPAEYGGAGFDTLCLALTIEEISRVDASIGMMLSATNALVQGAILKYGNDEQKQGYLTDLATGKTIGANGLGEAEDGEPFGRIETIAIPDGEHYILKGAKNFITNGSIADIFIIFAKMPGTDHQRISAFLLKKDLPGFQVQPIVGKMGVKAEPMAHISLKDCRVPMRNLLGKEGDGFKIAQSQNDSGRIAMAAQALGIARGAFEEALAYSKVRVQFGQPICNFQAIRFMFADMATDIEATRMLVYKAASQKDQGASVAKEAAMAKLFASEAASRCVHKATQIHGGYGYVKEYPVERYYRDQMITELSEGSSDVQRTLIANSFLKD